MFRGAYALNRGTSYVEMAMLWCRIPRFGINQRDKSAEAPRTVRKPSNQARKLVLISWYVIETIYRDSIEENISSWNHREGHGIEIMIVGWWCCWGEARVLSEVFHLAPDISQSTIKVTNNSHTFRPFSREEKVDKSSEHSFVTSSW
jgi:hypothetical protein